MRSNLRTAKPIEDLRGFDSGRAFSTTPPGKPIANETEGQSSLTSCAQVRARS